MPVFIEDGAEVLGSGTKPSEVSIDAKRVLVVVQLHDGVMSHAAARRLERMGYGFQSEAHYEQNWAGAVKAVVSNESATWLKELALAAGAVPSCAQESPKRIHFDTNIELQKWLQLHEVDFAEIFRGMGEATVRVREAGCTAAEGFDKYAITYERCWHLDQEGDQADLAWLLVYALRPIVVHLGVPCTRMGRLGKRDIDQTTMMQNDFSRKVLKHQ